MQQEFRHKRLHCTVEGYSCLAGKENNRKHSKRMKVKHVLGEGEGEMFT